MTPKEKLEAIKADLQKVLHAISDEGIPEDFDPQGLSGGNFDDCYWMGFYAGHDDGRDHHAIELFNKFFAEEDEE